MARLKADVIDKRIKELMAEGEVQSNPSRMQWIAALTKKVLGHFTLQSEPAKADITSLAKLLCLNYDDLVDKADGEEEVRFIPVPKMRVL